MSHSEIRSEITGIVLKLIRREGENVSRGDTILLIESMKMEIAVDADRDGTIRRILVGEGEAVAEGQTLATIENSVLPEGSVL